MKKSDFTASLVIIIVCVLLMIMLWLRSGDSFVPSYRFLGGLSPVACKKANRETEDSRGNVDTLYIYSFEADFNDVCLNAKSELTSAGFVNRTHPGNESHERRYWLKGSFPRGPVDINILNNYEYIEHPISKKGGLGHKDGWIVVTIAYWRNWW